MTIKFKWLMVSLVCLTIVVSLFYGLFWKHIRVFDQQGLYLQGSVEDKPHLEFMNTHLMEQLNLSVEENAIATIVFHWLDVDCQCTILGQLFIEKLIGKGKEDDVLHIVLTPPNLTQLTKERLSLSSTVKVIALSEDAYQASVKLIPATPAASVYNLKAQSLSYLGPHSSGVTCGRGNNFIELVLNNLSHGFDPKLYELESTGCFCAW